MDPARDREVTEEEEWLGEEYARTHGGRRLRGRSRAVVSVEIRATIIDHVINHGLSMREAGMSAAKSATLNSGIYCEKCPAKR